MTSAYAAFHHPAFRAFLIGRVVAVLGMQVLSVAVGWQVYALTGRPLDLGYVGLVQFAVQFLLFPVAGTVVDRFDRRRVLQACYLCYLCGAAFLFGVTWEGAPSVGAIFAGLVLVATGRAFSGPAGQAMLPTLVPGEHFANAVSWNSSGFTVGVVAGPALGGLIYGWTDGAAVPYGLSAALLFIALLASLFLPRRQVEHGAQRPGFREALDGVRFIWKRKILLSAITLDLFAVLFGGAVALLPIYARDVLHIGPEGMGVLRAAPAVGALLTAVGLAHRPIRRNVGRTLYVAVAVFGVATVIFGLSTNFWLSLVALALAGASDEISVFIRLNVVQMATPDQVRGRVSAAEFVFIGASNELGELESGLTAQWWGAVTSVLFGGIGTLVVVVTSALASRQLRGLDRMEDLRERPEE